MDLGSKQFQLTPDKIDCTLKLVKRDKKGHSTFIKLTTHQEDTVTLNMYLPNGVASTST